jgi:hypothetical protein
VGGDRFLLVREEFEEEKETVRTVARELEVGTLAPHFRVVRASAAEDVRRFLHSGLTPDGRFYWWIGPRKRPEKRRIEVREVATGKQVFALECPVPTGTDFEPRANLTADGQFLCVETFGHEPVVYDLGGNKHPQSSVCEFTGLRASTQTWTAFQLHRDDAPEDAGAMLRLARGQDVRFKLANSDLSNPEAICFSGDGRFLAYGSQTGTVTVVDLEVLSQQFGDFESSVLSK